MVVIWVSSSVTFQLPFLLLLQDVGDNIRRDLHSHTQETEHFPYGSNILFSVGGTFSLHDCVILLIGNYLVTDAHVGFADVVGEAKVRPFVPVHERYPMEAFWLSLGLAQ